MQLASPGQLFDFFRGKKRSEDLTVPIINQMLGFIRLVHDRSAKQASCVQYLYYWCDTLHGATALGKSVTAQQQAAAARHDNMTQLASCTLRLRKH